MKKAILIFMCFGMLMGISSAAGGGFGLGIVLGDPSGISAKISMSPENSVNLIFGYDLNGGPGCCRNDGQLYLGGDYVWYNYSLIPVSDGRLPFYFGPGINASISNNSRIGARGVAGLEYQFARVPMDLFLEIGPGINVMPNTGIYVTGGFGARFFF